ncbi:MAG TPA: helix-turn-helix domain-containing protein [Solirubrobacteraceae bacterium]|jgi:transcriptional regulator with XRE-family HTH domain
MDADALVRRARTDAKLTQAELARRLGTSQPAVVKLERPGANPTVRTLDRVLRATGHRLELGAPAWSPGIDESLIRKQLELSPAERLRQLERQSAEMRRLMIAGARNRGELP